MKVFQHRYALGYEDVILLHLYHTQGSSDKRLFYVLQQKRYKTKLDRHNCVIADDYSIAGMLMKADIANAEIDAPVIVYDMDRRNLTDSDIEMIDDFCHRHNVEFYVVSSILTSVDISGIK